MLSVKGASNGIAAAAVIGLCDFTTTCVVQVLSCKLCHIGHVHEASLCGRHFLFLTKPSAAVPMMEVTSTAFTALCGAHPPYEELKHSYGTSRTCSNSHYSSINTYTHTQMLASAKYKVTLESHIGVLGTSS